MNLLSMYLKAGASPCLCDDGDRLRREKVFIMMEDSNMMQKIVIQANEDLKMEISSVRNHIQKIFSDISTSWVRVVEEPCRPLNRQKNLRVDWNMTWLDRDIQQNVSVQQLQEMEEEEKKREKMKDEKNLEEIMEIHKTEKMEDSGKWWRLTKRKFWSW